MKEILLTSSALILALLALRRLFRRTVSRRVQYALWGLVLLRLLAPVSLPAAEFSLLTAAEPAVRDFQAVYAMPYREIIAAPEGAGTVYPYKTAPDVAVGPASPDNTRTFTDRFDVAHATRYSRQFTLPDLLAPVWYGGMLAMACWLVCSNLRFWGMLRKCRKPFAAEGCKYPVYLVEEGLLSPCLFGLFRPAIYLTPAAASPERLRHVLAHEETHGRHWDPLWSLLRGVCLTVYWFDPLVWWAALASRTDCELACDEGALKRLGADQRIPYGQTLLSLVPVRKTPANPLLSATTMTADKRQLKDRVTRIAENRRTWGAALIAVIVLTVLLCAVTFTGAKAPEPEPLSEEEIEWFNSDFFNGPDVNMRDYFLTCLYEDPQHIDLYQLFYYGAGTPVEFTETDRKFLESHVDGLPFEDDELLRIRCSKIPVSDMEAVMREFTSIEAREADWEQTDLFLWSEENNAYYNVRSPYTLDENGMRMDATYRMYDPVQIVSGERDGDLVRLYYNGEVYTGATSSAHMSLCVTLRQVGDSYYFVSNLPRSNPAVYPNAAVTIPLDGLKPKDLQPVQLLEVSGMRLLLKRTMDALHASDLLDPYTLMFMSDDESGRIYAGVQHMAMSSLPQPFLEIPGENFTAGYFQDVLGYDGFTISYTGADGYPVCDYYFLTKDGEPVLLARCGQDVQQIDLDSDGEKELVSCPGYGAQLVFLRDGNLYEANLRAMVQEAWPEADSITFDGWDSANRCLGLSAFTPYDASDGPTRLAATTRTAFRALYYDGENLLLTEDPRSPAENMDHMMGRYDATGEVLDAAPGEVLDAARTVAEDAFKRRQSEGFDDWRVCTVKGPYEEIVGGKRFEIWQTDYELHIPSPTVLSGSAHLSEPAWLEARRPTYLIFQIDRDQRTLFTTFLESDSAPGTHFFRNSLLSAMTRTDGLTFLNVKGSELEEMFRNQPEVLMEEISELKEVHQNLVLERLADPVSLWDQEAWDSACRRMQAASLSPGGAEMWRILQELVAPRQTPPRTPPEALEMMMDGDYINMTLLAPEGGGRYDADPQAGNGPNRAKYFPIIFDWKLAEDTYVKSSPITLMLISQGGDFSLHFYPGSSLVLLHTYGRDRWFYAIPKDDPDVLDAQNIFDFMRLWYDEAEISGLRAKISIPDQGQSREEIAKAWADAYEGAALKVASGSMYACTYVKNESVSLADWINTLSEEEKNGVFPKFTEGHERFAFVYTTVFVPENDGAQTWLWAGNTGYYTGNDAPEGAFEYSCCGYMYRTEDGWRCDEVGTGW